MTSFTLIRMAVIKLKDKNQKTTNIGRNARRLECSIGWKATWCSSLENGLMGPQKIKNRTTT